MSQHKIRVNVDGSLQFVCDDRLMSLVAQHNGETRPLERASHVEPNDEGKWEADLSPVGGPLLGPFELRADALQAEREWLEENWV